MPGRIARNVLFTPELGAFVAERVASGRYSSVSEVVRAALRAYEQQETRRAGRSANARSTQQR